MQPGSKKQPNLMWPLLAGAGGILAIGVIAYMLIFKPSAASSTIRTFFAYDQQVTDTLRSLAPTGEITIDEVHKWEDKAYELVSSHGSVDVDASKVYAYLNAAQMDAAALSYKAHKTFAGSVELVSKNVLCEFYPASCNSLVTTHNDPYAVALSDAVMQKIKARITEDGAQTKPAALKAGAAYWNGPAPQIGLSAASFKPWFLSSGSQFRPAPPPTANPAELQQQLATLKQEVAKATNEQKAIVIKWAGGPGTRTPPGIWLAVATDYMHEKLTPLDTYLTIRFLLAASMADAVIGAFDAKYFYQFKRPNMFDASITPIMPTPNHPSYPAGHATISWAAATILSKYLPDNQQEWSRLATEATDSRLVGGIHFQADNAAGTALGTAIGNQVLKGWQE